MTTDRSQLGLGKKPPANRVSLRMKDLLTGVPATPVAADNFSRVRKWHLGENDRYGTCGPTYVANSLLLTTTYLSNTPVYVSDDDIIDLYRRSGNPNFPRQDGGVVIQDMLEELLKNGIGGHKPLAFASVEPGDMDTLDRCIALFGGVGLGLDLKVPQQTQDVWDAVGGREWGGHAVLSGRYVDPAGQVSDRTGIITWAQVVDMTRDFVQLQEDECWVVIWPEHLGDKSFLEGVDVPALAAAYEELTGRPFPMVAPPPAPNPSPSSADAADEALAKTLRHQITLRSVSKRAKAAFLLWLADKGL